MGRNFSLKFRVNHLRWSLLSWGATAAAAAVLARAQDGAVTLSIAQGRQSGLAGCDAISRAGNPSLGLCADIARVCANLLPRRLRARGQSVRDHGSAVDQMHSRRLRREFSKAVGWGLWPYAKPRKGACPLRPAQYLRGPTSDPPAVPIDESDQSTGRRGDQ
jgi:hypothetical protein